MASASGPPARTTIHSQARLMRPRSSQGRGISRPGTGSTAPRHVTCRLANVYGPRQLPTLEGGVIAIFLDRLRDGKETEIFGDGNQTRDFVYVGDVVEAMLAAAASPAGAVYNIGSGVATTVGELHRLCAETAGVQQEPRFGAARAGDLRHSVIDPSRAARELDWRAHTTLAAGLRPETQDAHAKGAPPGPLPPA